MRARIVSIFLTFILVILVSSPASADSREILVFRDVAIPWTLTHDDVVMEKGKYDVMLVKHGVEIFCLKIRQKGKLICFIKDPARIKYANQGNISELLRDKSVPKQATLNIKRNSALNIVYFLIETGNCRKCKFQKLRFKVNALET